MTAFLRRAGWLAGLASLALVAVPATAQVTAAQRTAIDQLMRPYDGNVPGASLLVIKDGKPVVRKAWGYADLQNGIKATPATNYRLASVTKQFTAAAILLLAEDGKLSIDDPVKKWLPGLPAVADRITIRNLLSHTSGIVDYEDVMDQDQQWQLLDADVLKLLEGQHGLYFAPGSQYRYSNSAYALLALIVGKASGSDFASFLKARIFKPLGMDNTVAYEPAVSSVSSRAWGNTEEHGGWRRTDQGNTSAVLGDGGIYTSIDDMQKWDAALYDERLLKASSLAQAFSPQVEVPGEAGVSYYGFGWRIKDDVLWHSGESRGFRNVIVRWPKEKLTVVILTNRNDPGPYDTAMAVAKLFRKP